MTAEKPTMKCETTTYCSLTIPQDCLPKGLRITAHYVYGNQLTISGSTPSEFRAGLMALAALLMEEASKLC